jgi:hypothetical protein
MRKFHFLPLWKGDLVLMIRCDVKMLVICDIQLERVVQELWTMDLTQDLSTKYTIILICITSKITYVESIEFFKSQMKISATN